MLIIGSGLSFHNLGALRAQKSAEDAKADDDFHTWLDLTLSDSDVSEAERADKLAGWKQAPGAQYCHPREEHLLPIHVCSAAAGQPVSDIVPFDFLGFNARCYLWGA